MKSELQLTTTYLGLKIRSPFVVGASPLTENTETLVHLQEAGAGAVVMHSLFEEQLTRESAAASSLIEASADSYGEALSYFPAASDYALGPDEYLKQIAELKGALTIPVVASLNGCTTGGWVAHAELMEQAGADAIELNIYELVTDLESSAEDVEKRLLEIVISVKERVTVPLCVKLSPFYTALPSVVRRVQLCGAAGVVLFNRFYQPDLNIEELTVEPRLFLSTSSELLLRLRWLAILYGKLPLSLILGGGVHKSTDAVKGIMAGADAIQIVSAVLRNGNGAFLSLVEGFKAWMDEHEYETVDQMRGVLSHENCPDPSEFERANYLRTLQLWKS